MSKGLTRSLKNAAQTAAGSADIGTQAGTGVVATDQRIAGGEVRQVLLTLTDVEFALTDVASTVAYSGLKVYDFPAGAVLFLGATASLTMVKDAAGVSDSFAGDFGVGTVTASNNGTLATTEQNLIPTTEVLAVDDTATIAAISTSTEAAKVLDGTSTAVDVYVNVLVDDGDQDVTSTPTSLIANGTVKLTYLMLGDI